MTQEQIVQKPAFFLTEEEQAMVDEITAQLLSENAEEHDGFFDEENSGQCQCRMPA